MQLPPIDRDRLCGFLTYMIVIVHLKKFLLLLFVAQFIARGDAKRRALIRAHGDKSPYYELKLKIEFKA